MSGFKTQPPVMMCGMNVAGINKVDQRGRWHLSYNPSVQGYGCVTTAMVFDNRVFFVLEGDHRKAWGEAADLRRRTGLLHRAPPADQRYE